MAAAMTDASPSVESSTARAQEVPITGSKCIDRGIRAVRLPAGCVGKVPYFSPGQVLTGVRTTTQTSGDPTVTKSGTISRIAIALALTAVVGACSGSSSSNAPAASTAASVPAASALGTKTYKDLTVGFIQTGSESGWRAANT